MADDKTQVQNKTEEQKLVEEGKAVFSPRKVEDFEKTPEWMKDSSNEATANKIVGAESQASSEPALEPIVQLKAEKPSKTAIGEDPSSSIEVLPSLEVVKKVDVEAAKKLTDAGYNPATGHKIDEEKTKDDATAAQDVKDAAVAGKKKSFFDSIKSLFVIKTKKNKGVVEKVDKAATITDANGKKIRISTDERKKYIEAEKIYQEGISSIKDLIAPSSMDIQYDSIKIDGVYARTFYVFAYPRFLNANWLAPIINFDVTMDISQFIYPIESGSIMKTLKKKVAQMQSSMRINAEKGQVRDPGLETALEDAEVLRTKIQRGQEKFFQFALYFTIYSESEKKLEKVAKQLESLLAGKLIMTKRCQLQAEHGFNASLPQCLDELYTIRNMNTGPLSTTFPFTSSDLTSDKGILYGINRHNDGLIIFDRFALENANSVVFAKSGAGKSYGVKLEILRLMMMGTDVIVIDPENEYEALATTVGGNYLRLSLNSDRRINPFDLPKPVEGEDVQSGDLLRSNILTLQGLLKLMLGGISPEEEGILDKALIDVYALKGITMEIEDPSTFEPPTMEDLYQILNSMEGANSLVQRLSKYTVGSYSGIFNKPTNVDLSGGLMVFCIRDLEDALRPTAMYIILNYIWSKVRSKLKKRMLVIDEAWSMMQHEDSAKFLYGLVKRARKYYLGVTTITQDVEDFIKSDYGKPIITNSSMQLLLKQAPSAVDTLAKIFNLTEGEKYVLLNSGVGQGLFFAGLKHVAIQIIASYTEDKIVTTNPEEVLKERAEVEGEDN
jgi:conjugal transfer ATP-binding protein TraC